jgi:AraC-like DNA-binding protein
MATNPLSATQGLFQLYYLINDGFAGFAATIAVLFATLAVPPNGAIRNYRLSLHFMAASYMVLSLGTITEALFREAAMTSGMMLNVYLRMISSSYVIVLFKTAMICIVNAGYLKVRKVALECVPTTILSVAILAIASGFLPESLESPTFWIFRLYYAFQLLRSGILFQGYTRQIKERIDNYYAGQKDSYLAWIRQITYLWISIALFAFCCFLLPSSTLMLALSIYAALAFVASGIRYLNFAFAFHQLAPVFALEPAEPQAASTLVGIDVDGLLGRLSRLMERDRLYADEGLTIARLGERLGVSRNQLSELVNCKIGMNFRNYINSLRIEDAKRMLEADPSAGILDIALSCGFNSKSTFNAAFSRHAGTNPSEWRRSNCLRPNMTTSGSGYD